MTCHVYLLNKKCGFLKTENSSLVFQYDHDYLKDTQNIPLSQSLPLKPDPFTQTQCMGFFEGLLPEGDRRNLLAMTLHVSLDNTLELLRHIGRDCAGAIQIFDENENIDMTEKEPLYSEILSEGELMTLLTKFKIEGKEEYKRLSLAGAQNKCPLILHENKNGKREYRYPLKNTPSTHIVKIGKDAFPDLVDNEAYCLAIAKELGLTSITPFIETQFSQKLLVVDRYDRITKNGLFFRLHQEDFCQALGLISAYKYNSGPNGPGVKEIFSITRYATQEALAVIKMLKYILFHILIGDDDGHAKNYSLLYKNKEIELAPLYDAVCTRLYPELERILQPTIGGQSRLDFLEGQHIKKFFDDIGFRTNGAQKIALSFIDEFETKVFSNSIHIESMNEEIKKPLHKIFKTQIAFLRDACLRVK